jgi:hypothetical protein
MVFVSLNLLTVQEYYYYGSSCLSKVDPLYFIPILCFLIFIYYYLFHLLFTPNLEDGLASQSNIFPHDRLCWRFKSVNGKFLTPCIYTGWAENRSILVECSDTLQLAFQTIARTCTIITSTERYVGIGRKSECIVHRQGIGVAVSRDIRFFTIM